MTLEARYVPADPVLLDGTRANSLVRAGQLLPRSALGLDDGTNRRPVSVDLPDALPAAITSGAHVDVWVSLKDREANSYAPPTLLLPAAEVTARTERATGFGGTAGTLVEILVVDTGLADLLEAMANDARITVVFNPGSERLMNISVVVHGDDGTVVDRLESHRGVLTVARSCAEIAEVIALCETGLADAAILAGAAGGSRNPRHRCDDRTRCAGGGALRRRGPGQRGWLRPAPTWLPTGSTAPDLGILVTRARAELGHRERGADPARARRGRGPAAGKAGPRGGLLGAGRFPGPVPAGAELRGGMRPGRSRRWCCWMPTPMARPRPCSWACSTRRRASPRSAAPWTPGRFDADEAGAHLRPGGDRRSPACAWPRGCRGPAAGPSCVPRRCAGPSWPCRRAATLIVVDVAAPLELDEELSFDTAAPQRNGVTAAMLRIADEIYAVGAADSIGVPRLIRALEEMHEVLGELPVKVLFNKVSRGQCRGLARARRWPRPGSASGPALPDRRVPAPRRRGGRGRPAGRQRPSRNRAAFRHSAWPSPPWPGTGSRPKAPLLRRCAPSM